MMCYRQLKNQQLEDALFLWFSDMSSHHAAINDEILIMKAKTLGEQLNFVTLEGGFNALRTDEESNASCTRGKLRMQI